MRSLSLIAILTSLAFQSVAQDEKRTTFNFGVGAGIDYGGFGAKISLFSFSPKAELVLGGGYNLLNVGWNAGVVLRTSPEAKTAFFVNPMYGYNSVLSLTAKGPYGTSHFNKTYYGPSFGLGLEFRGEKKKNFFKIAMIIPFRSKEFKNDFDKYEDEFRLKVQPVYASLGYHFVFNR
jgi:hypothetical protein